MGTVKHAKVSLIPDGTDTDLVRPSDWNADHVLVLDKADVGLGNVDNTSDADKPISTATQAAFDAMKWQIVTVDTTLVSGTPYIASGATTLNMTLPLDAPVSSEFIVHAKGASHRVVSNGNVITGVGAGNDLLIEDGNTAHLVASATGQLEIV